MGCSRNRKNDKRDDHRRNDNVRFIADIEIDRDEFCREVRRCLRDVDVAGAQEENNNNDRRRKRCRF